MKIILPFLLAFSLLGCDDYKGPPAAEDCKEFPYRTMHNGQIVTCQVLWCNRGNIGDSHMGSGMAVLWCDSATSSVSAPAPVSSAR